MRNIGLQHFKTATVENFTTNIGIKVRRFINPLLRVVYRIATPGRIVVDTSPKLEKDTPYIFVCTHSFVDEVTAALSAIDRSAYLLFGTTDQLETNPIVYAAWMNGFIYVDRTDKTSRNSAVDKMERILKSGSSVFLFPEGGFNNTENLLVQKLFASPYYLAKRTGTKVVPISTFHEYESKDIFIRVGEPLELDSYSDKSYALVVLRDAMATLTYENIELHSTPICRRELGSEPRLGYMEERRKVYKETKWTRDVWDEELTQYLDAADREHISVIESTNNIRLNKDNVSMMLPLLCCSVEAEKYDFKKYMHENWNREEFTGGGT